MIVISVTNAPAQLRGYLTRYLSEIQAGLFVGCCSARVRDALWKRVQGDLPEHGKAILVHNEGNEQGYRVDYWIFPNKTMVWLDGLGTPATIDNDDGIVSPSSRRFESHWSKAYWRRKRS